MKNNTETQVAERQVMTQRVVKHTNVDMNSWDCNGNNVSSGLCSSNTIRWLESKGKHVIIEGENVRVVDAN
jgi:hypothetical protein